VKIQIIYLDPQDDHASAREKLNWCQAPRAALVWPDRGRILTRRMDLVLIDRHAQKRGVKVGLVTLDPTIREHALAIGIPTFDSVDDVSQETWYARRPPSPAAPEPERDRIRIRERLFSERRSLEGIGRSRRILQWVIGVIGLVALIVLVGALLPSAQLVLAPETQMQWLEFEITLDPELAAASASGILPARLNSVVLQGSSSRSTSTRVSVPSGYATGTVVFTNLTPDPIVVTAGTGVRTISDPAIRFQTITTASLPGGPDTTASARVRAVEAGTSSNIPAEAIQAIEGLLGLEVTVRNPEAFDNGSDVMQYAVSEGDLDALQADLIQSLLDEAETEWIAALDEDQILVAESITVSQIFDLDFSHPAGEVAESVALSMEAEITGLTYVRADLESILQQTMDAALNDNQQAVPGSLEWTLVSEAQLGGDGRYAFSLLAGRSTYEAIDRRALASQLQGRSIPEAETILAAGRDLTVEEISIWPRWFPNLPWLSLRITIIWAWENP
jgi:hypothetical protein